MILLNALADVVLMQWLGHTGIALSTSIVALTNLWWLLRILARRLGGLDERAILGTAARTAAAGLALAVAILGTVWVAGKFVNVETFGGAATQLGAALLVGGAVYLGACALLGVPELSMLRSFVKGRQAIRPSRSPVGV